MTLDSQLPMLMLLFSVLFTFGQTVSTDEFVVGSGEVLAPEGTFLLVRKGTAIGAVRFMSIERGTVAGK
jgi:hypothetical protein